MIWLEENNFEFPNSNLANEEGLLAVGGNLQPTSLIKSYKSGIFPWYNKGEPLLWWCPNPRFVLYPERAKWSNKNLKIWDNTSYKITYNTAFSDVIKKCAQIPRKEQNGTWIHSEMVASYIQLHQMGFGYSIEIWDNHHLVGGLYGILLKNGVFSGESMFSQANNAGKLAFMALTFKKELKLIDCQTHSPHIENWGGEFIERNQFLKILNS